MIIEEIGRGSTVDEAKEDAILKLGIGEDEEFEFDIISMPKKKTLGLFGGKDAEVKVWITRPDPKGEKKQKQKADHKKENKKEKNAPSKKESKKEENKQENAVPAESLTEKTVLIKRFNT